MDRHYIAFITFYSVIIKHQMWSYLPEPQRSHLYVANNID